MSSDIEDEKNPIAYARKPLTFLIPALRPTQAHKNPFRKYVKQKTMNCEDLPKIQPSGKNKFLSLTPTQEKRARGDLFKIPQPSRFGPEFWEAPMEEEVPAEKKPLTVKPEKETKQEEEEKNTEETPEEDIDLGQFHATLNPEVLYNFQQMENIHFLVSMDEIAKKYVTLPEKKETKSNKTIILDLDETLVHTINPTLNYSSIPINFKDVKQAVYQDPVTHTFATIDVVVRPGAMEFLKALKGLFEVVVFTAGHKNYAQSLLLLIDPTEALIDFKLFREQCVQRSNHYIKDLRIIKNRSMKNIMILDNTIIAFSNNLDNGIHIPTFFGSQNDTALYHVIPLLKLLAKAENIQTEIRKVVGLSGVYLDYLKSKLKS